MIYTPNTEMRIADKGTINILIQHDVYTTIQASFYLIMKHITLGTSAVLKLWYTHKLGS